MPPPPDERAPRLPRATAVVYWYVVTEVCFLLAAVPTFAGFLLLDRSAGNIPFFALALVPLAPAVTAAVSTLHARTPARSTAGELSVWPRFWRFWVRDVVDVLRWWVPVLAFGAVLAYNAVFATRIGMAPVFSIGAVVLLVFLALFSMNAVALTAVFSFRTRDVARLSLYYIGARPAATVGSVALLIVATGVVYAASDAALAALAVVFAAFLLVTHRAVLEDARARFVAA